MGILLIGASGRTGQLVLDEALARGHSVTALVRNTSSIPSPNRTGLTIVEGTPTNAPDIEHAIASTPASDRITSIVTTLNARRASDSPFAKVISPPTLLADCHNNLVAVMRMHPEIQKIVALSAWGAGESIKEVPRLLKLLFEKSNMAEQFQDHNLTDQALKDSGVDFTLVRPVRLTDTEKKPVTVYGQTGKGLGMFKKVSRASVASFLVDCTESSEWSRRTPVISE